MNIPEWFEPAAFSYERLGKKHLAQFIRRASLLVLKEQEQIKVASKNLEDAFAYFREGAFSEFDNQLDDIGWRMDEFRIAYVRQNREAFLEVEKFK